MNERRKSLRRELISTLVVNRLDGGGDDQVLINVVDASKTGIGFTSDRELNIGALYEVNLKIWTQEVIHAFIEILRFEKRGDINFYGALFIGMSEMDSSRIETYNTVEEYKNTVEENKKEDN